MADNTLAKISITVLNCRGLFPLSPSGTSNPFVKLFTNETTEAFKTQVVDRNCNPDFNSGPHVVVVPMYSVLEFKVFHHMPFEDMFLGKYTFSIFCAETKTRECTLTPGTDASLDAKTRSKGGCGRLSISYTIEEMSAEESDKYRKEHQKPADNFDDIDFLSGGDSHTKKKTSGVSDAALDFLSEGSSAPPPAAPMMNLSQNNSAAVAAAPTNPYGSLGSSSVPATNPYGAMGSNSVAATQQPPSSSNPYGSIGSGSVAAASNPYGALGNSAAPSSLPPQQSNVSNVSNSSSVNPYGSVGSAPAAAAAMGGSTHTMPEASASAANPYGAMGNAPTAAAALYSSTTPASALPPAASNPYGSVGPSPTYGTDTSMVSSIAHAAPTPLNNLSSATTTTTSLAAKPNTLLSGGSTPYGAVGAAAPPPGPPTSMVPAADLSSTNNNSNPNYASYNNNVGGAAALGAAVNTSQPSYTATAQYPPPLHPNTVAAPQQQQQPQPPTAAAQPSNSLADSSSIQSTTANSSLAASRVSSMGNMLAPQSNNANSTNANANAAANFNGDAAQQSLLNTTNLQYNQQGGAVGGGALSPTPNAQTPAGIPFVASSSLNTSAVNGTPVAAAPSSNYPANTSDSQAMTAKQVSFDPKTTKPLVPRPAATSASSGRTPRDAYSSAHAPATTRRAPSNSTPRGRSASPSTRGKLNPSLQQPAAAAASTSPQRPPPAPSAANIRLSVAAAPTAPPLHGATASNKALYGGDKSQELLAAAVDGTLAPFKKVKELDPLLAHGFMQVTDYAGRNALHLAAWYGHVELLELLLGSGTASMLNIASMTTKNAKNTILHTAAMGGNPQTVEWLLFQPACQSLPMLRNTRGLTPYQCALEAGNVECAKALASVSGVTMMTQ